MELKNCPFCNGMPRIRPINDWEKIRIQVKCSSCPAQVESYTKEKAIEHWNKRPTEEHT